MFNAVFEVIPACYSGQHCSKNQPPLTYLKRTGQDNITVWTDNQESYGKHLKCCFPFRQT